MITFSNGNTKIVTHSGTIDLLPKFHLTQTLYTPNFKHNLLFVSKLTKTSHISVLFYQSYCIF